jgi:hypothetical protein
LTNVPVSVTKENLAHEGRLREGTFGSGASAVPPRGLATRAGAALGIIPFGTTAEAWGAATELGQDRAGNARPIPNPRKHGLKLSRRCQSLRREPRSKRRKAGAPPKMARSRAADEWRRLRTLASDARHMVGMRLSALRLPFFCRGRIFFGARDFTQSSDTNVLRERLPISSLPAQGAQRRLCIR